MRWIGALRIVWSDLWVHAGEKCWMIDLSVERRGHYKILSITLLWETLTSGAKSLEICLDGDEVWKQNCLGVYEPTNLSKDQFTSHTLMNWATGKDFVMHALDFAFGDLCQECPGFDLGCGAVHSIIMPWEACWQGWVDGRGLLSYFLANLWEEAFPKCLNPVIFE